jgi:hypothetical protein
MEDEDYRIMVLNDTTMKVFRDGRIHTFHNRRKTWTNRKFNTNNDGYYRIKVGTNEKNITLLVHNVVALCYLGEKPDEYHADHINNIRTDNRLENLQYITAIDNYRKRTHKNKQPIKGYTRIKSGKYVAQIHHNYKGINLGTYDTEEEARQAYIDGKLKYHGVQF